MSSRHESTVEMPISSLDASWIRTQCPSGLGLPHRKIGKFAFPLKIFRPQKPGLHNIGKRGKIQFPPTGKFSVILVPTHSFGWRGHYENPHDTVQDTKLNVVTKIDLYTYFQKCLDKLFYAFSQPFGAQVMRNNHWLCK